MSLISHFQKILRSCKDYSLFLIPFSYLIILIFEGLSTHNSVEYIIDFTLILNPLLLSVEFHK